MIAMLREHGIRLFAATTWYALSAPREVFIQRTLRFLLGLSFFLDLRETGAGTFASLASPSSLASIFFLYTATTALESIWPTKSVISFFSRSLFVWNDYCGSVSISISTAAATTTMKTRRCGNRLITLVVSIPWYVYFKPSNVVWGCAQSYYSSKLVPVVTRHKRAIINK